MLRFGFQSLVIGFLVLTVSATGVAQVSASPSAEAQKNSDSAERNIHDLAALSRLFLKSLASIQADKIGQSVDDLTEIRDIAKELGLANLPEYSFSLLEQAATYQERWEYEKSRFLVRQAVLLSPQDGRVYLGAAGYFPAIGTIESLEYFLKGLTTFWNYPSALAACIVNAVLITLVAASLTLFLVIVIYVSKNIGAMLDNFSRLFPQKRRKKNAPVFFLTLMLAPLFIGLLFALGIWALLLALLNPRQRRLSLVVGCLVVSWAFAIPAVSNIQSYLDSAAVRIIEQVNSGSYSPSYLADLEQVLKRRPNDAVLHLTYAKTLAVVGRDDDAKNALRSVERTGVDQPMILGAAHLTEAVLLYREKDFEGSRKKLLDAEKSGIASFELWSNLAQVSMELLDTERYRLYYNEATRSENKRELWLAQLPLRGRDMLLPRLPEWFIAEKMFEGPVEMRDLLFLRNDTWTPLIRLLAPGETPAALLFLGIGVFLGGLALIHGRWQWIRRLKAGAGLFDRQASVAWLYLPAGAQLIRGRLVLSSVILTAIFGLVILATGRPVPLIPVTPLAVVQPQLYLWAAATIAFSAVLVARPWGVKAVKQNSRGKR